MHAALQHTTDTIMVAASATAVRTGPTSPAHVTASHAEPSLPGSYVDERTFESKVLNASKPVMVLFTVPGCGSCKYFKETAFRQVLAYYSDQFDIYEFVCSTMTQTDKHYNVVYHPTTIVFSAGEDIGEYIGGSVFEYFKNHIDSICFRAGIEP